MLSLLNSLEGLKLLQFINVTNISILFTSTDVCRRYLKKILFLPLIKFPDLWYSTR